jgi:hypothetical protein
MLFMLSPWFQQIQDIQRSKLALQIVGGVLGIAGAFAALIIWFGMTAFLLLEDASSRRIRVLWLILFFVTAWFGSAAYFFTVYRRQVANTPSG